MALLCDTLCSKNPGVVGPRGRFEPSACRRPEAHCWGRHAFAWRPLRDLFSEELGEWGSAEKMTPTPLSPHKLQVLKPFLTVLATKS